jgi:decaprenylphospho-beta-D-ribofuranose 2-oxidase
MKMHGWGRYPVVDAEVYSPTSQADLQKQLSSLNGGSITPRGLGRSYGDSSLGEKMFSTRWLKHMLAFDQNTGILYCESGVSLIEILDVFVPKGWFLPVTPGTQFVTVGGAIASDVHGKNHHVSGCFCDHVESVDIFLNDERTIHCSRKDHPDLFHATCGGMGLTGIILSASLQLKPIKSALIDQMTCKAKNIEEVLALFETEADKTYSVAWIDCIAKGSSLGRSLLMVGEHSLDGGYPMLNKKQIGFPFDMPSQLLNRFTVQAFNTLYYNRIHKLRVQRNVHYAPFFYPLDSVNDWNRLYGKHGFTQYQFVIPKAAGLEGMTKILHLIAASGRGSFLAVLKVFGMKNDNLLSFPMEGYTLALDFKVESELFPLLDKLDLMVLDYGGRLYLTKDARMSEATFKRSYPEWERFQSVRESYGVKGKFTSHQSKRLGLD